jgi:hypothetical protein
VMQCIVARDIFSRDFEFERVCRNGIGKNIPRHITEPLTACKEPLECGAVYCGT